MIYSQLRWRILNLPIYFLAEAYSVSCARGTDDLDGKSFSNAPISIPLLSIVLFLLYFSIRSCWLILLSLMLHSRSVFYSFFHYLDAAYQQRILFLCFSLFGCYIVVAYSIPFFIASMYLLEGNRLWHIQSTDVLTFLRLKEMLVQQIYKDFVRNKVYHHEFEIQHD